MPRKRMKEKKKIVLYVDGIAYAVTMFPPKGREKSWHAYWKGLPTRKSTKERAYDAAVKAVERMLSNGGQLPDSKSASMSDDEFVEIQRRHYKRIGATAGTVDACLEAITAFQTISGVSPISLATADDCARFQDEAVRLPKIWRVQYGNEERRKEKISDESIERLSLTTVLKWSVALRAAFERANLNAGKKCVRNVVPPRKLLTINPWDQFTWVEDRSPVEVRQFSPDELLSVLDYFEQNFPSVTVARLAAQTFFWSCARRKEISSLKWSELRVVNDEIHFDILGKWRVRKWFRIPGRLYEELLQIKTDSEYVFGAYPHQLRRHLLQGRRPATARRVRTEFAPGNFGDWFYHRIVDWSQNQPNGGACVHVFRKTGLQGAVDGEAENQKVAQDACVNLRVMATHYTTDQERQFRAKSNRMFERIATSLPTDVLIRYGYTPKVVDPLVAKLEQAYREEDWAEVERLSGELRRRDQTG
ncbi:hypothetical protein SV7mr_20090 [Stieleria bergensis]|uniref:Phage integrase family protein n=1 Tax=Stieleria bergensis TaxID=2528025 RepID=A0A517STN9_9BACT|nr:hypothetical protein SV7mr_20090 [Planctomycetes bacterium SV_7m_r]